MVNIYTLRKALSNIGIYSIKLLKEQGIMYPIYKYNKPDTNIQISVDTSNEDECIIKLHSNFEKESDKDSWADLLSDNQFDLYPLLVDLICYLLAREIITVAYYDKLQYYYTFSEEEGSISVITKLIRI